MATSTNLVGSFAKKYFKCHKWPLCCTCSTSTSEIEVLHLKHQLIILSPRYISPSSNNLTKNSLTACSKPLSIVKRLRLKSQEAPNFSICLKIAASNSFFQLQACSKKASLPKSVLERPSFFNFSTIFASVAIAAWSDPGNHNASNPCIRLNRVKMSCKVMSRAWPMCNRPVTLGGGITMQKASFSELALA